MTNLKKYKILFKDLMRLLKISDKVNNKTILPVNFSKIHKSVTSYDNLNGYIENLKNVIIYDNNSSSIGFILKYENGNYDYVENDADLMIENIKKTKKYIIENDYTPEENFEYFKELIKPTEEYKLNIKKVFEEKIKEFQTIKMNRNFRTCVYKGYISIVKEEFKYLDDEISELQKSIQEMTGKLYELQNSYEHNVEKKMTDYCEKNTRLLVEDEKYLNNYNIKNQQEIEMYRYILEKEEYKELRRRLLY